MFDDRGRRRTRWGAAERDSAAGTNEGGGGAYACLFRERDGGYRQSRKVEAAEDGENYVCM